MKKIIVLALIVFGVVGCTRIHVTNSSGTTINIIDATKVIPNSSINTPAVE